MTRHAAGLLAIVLAAGACASSGTGGSEVYEVSGVDRAPELAGCAEYAEPAAAPPESGVEVRFVVDERGEVLPQTVQARGDLGQFGGADTGEMIATAERHAAGCQFRPGVRDGRPVAVRMTMEFYYPELYRRGS